MRMKIREKQMSLKELTQNPKCHYLLAFAVCIFLFLATWSALTTRPESDEGSFANPALNLAQNGHFGTTVFEPEKQTLLRIEQRTYWVLPLFLLNAAAAFKVFGFSLFAMRGVSIFWGLILLAAWYFIVLKISEDRTKAAVCTLFLACSYVVLLTASIGRGDTMCAALGFSAFAVYLWFREHRLLLAVFLSQSLVMLSGLTHFFGILAFFGLIFLTFYYDFRLLGWKHFLIAAVPYLIGGSAFGMWILQDFEAFKVQFVENAVMSGRMKGFSSPLSGILGEFTARYPRAFGLFESTAGHSGPIYLKSLMLVGYAIGVLGTIFNQELRRKYFPLLILTAIYFFTMALIDGQKLAVYLIYIIPFYTVLLGLLICTLWEKRSLPRPLILVSATGFLLLGIGGIAMRCKQNTYSSFYKPAMEFINQNSTQTDLVMGAPESRFALNSNINHIADGKFGMVTGKRPKYIIYDPGTEDSWKESKMFSPDFYEYFPRLLDDDYKIVYENKAYKVYEKR